MKTFNPLGQGNLLHGGGQAGETESGNGQTAERRQTETGLRVTGDRLPEDHLGFLLVSVQSNAKRD
jgi:hypothetical protein